jgi:hypothetical protein
MRLTRLQTTDQSMATVHLDMLDSWQLSPDNFANPVTGLQLPSPQEEDDVPEQQVPHREVC